MGLSGGLVVVDDDMAEVVQELVALVDESSMSDRRQRHTSPRKGPTIAGAEAHRVGSDGPNATDPSCGPWSRSRGTSDPQDAQGDMISRRVWRSREMVASETPSRRATSAWTPWP
jgi:hypothetical protein